MPFFIIAGPTAVGKTAVALEVARRLDAEIVGADAFQIYSGMPILTAKPSGQELASVKHHLIGCVPPEQSFDVGQYLTQAHACIAQIAAANKLALVVGGTGLYLRALMRGLADLPPADPCVRKELDNLNIETLQTRLHELDPLAAASIDLKNKRRIIRALEICVTTGKPFSSFRQQWNETAKGIKGVVLTMSREQLNALIDERTAAMFESGVVQEVARMRQPGTTAAQVLGLAPIRELIAGNITQSQTLETIQRQTRQYAKRQLTWFRREPELQPLDLSCGREECVKRICQLIESGSRKETSHL